MRAGSAEFEPTSSQVSNCALANRVLADRPGAGSALACSGHLADAALVAFWLGVAGVSVAASAVGAADSTAVEPVRLAPVEVTATRVPTSARDVPFSIDQLEGPAFDAKPGVSLDETLRGIPGVSVGDRGNLSQGDRISIRGIGSRASFGVRGLRVLLDDIPLTMPDGQSQLNNVDPGTIGELEVIRGPSAALYGNAAGGVIHLRSRAPAATASVTPAVVFGSHGLARLRLRVDRTVGAHAFLLSLGQLRRDGYRDRAEALTRNLSLVGRHQLSPTASLTSVVNIVDSPYLLNPSSLARDAARSDPRGVRGFVVRQGASKRVRQGQVGVTLRSEAGPGRLQATLYGLTRSLDNPIPGRIIELDRSGAGWRSTYTTTREAAGRSLRLAGGIDVEGQWDQRQEFDNGGLPGEAADTAPEDVVDAVQYGDRLARQDEQVVGVGPFLALAVDSGAWTVSVGGRYDRYRFELTDRFLDDGVDHSGARTMSQFSPAVGITCNPGEHLTLFASIATAFQTPTTVELNNRVDGAGGFNPDLAAETLRNLEVGLRGVSLPYHVEYSLAAFRFRVNDMLIPFQVAGGGEEIFYRNAGEAKNRGFEARLAWVPRPSLRGQLSYAVSDFEFTDFAVATADGTAQLAGNQVPGAPRQQWWVQWSYERRRWRGEVAARHVGEYFANDFNGPAPGVENPLAAYINDAYTTVDARLAVAIEVGRPLDLFIGIDNLLAEQYSGSIVPNAFGDRFFEPAPERAFYAGAALELR